MKRAISLVLAIMFLFTVSAAFASEAYEIPGIVRAESLDAFYGIWHAVIYGYGTTIQVPYSTYYQVLVRNMEEFELNGRMVPISAIGPDQFIIGSDNVFVSVWGSLIDGTQKWKFENGEIREEDEESGAVSILSLLADGRLIQRTRLEDEESYLIFERLEDIKPGNAARPLPESV